MTKHMRQARRLAATALAVVLGVLAGWIAMDSAEAATPDPEPVCATWKINGVGGEPVGSSVNSASKATLVKPEGENSGVEFVTNDLELAAGADELVVSVEYNLVDGAVSAGAVRLFGYAAQGVNPASPSAGAPDYGPDIAQAESGTLTLTIPAGQSLGTLGVTYDASNTSHGTLTVQDMAVDDRPVSFTACPEPTPSPSVTTPAATTPPATPPATDPAATPSGTVPPVAGGPSLPVTGVGLPQIVTAGILLLIAGAVAYLLSPVFKRRRRTTFEA